MLHENTSRRPSKRSLRKKEELSRRVRRVKGDGRQGRRRKEIGGEKTGVGKESKEPFVVIWKNSTRRS